MKEVKKVSNKFEKSKYKFYLVKQMTNTLFYKGIFLILIVAIIYYYMGTTEGVWGKSILDFFNFSVGIEVTVLVLLVSTQFTNYMFEKKKDIILRYQNLKTYYVELFKYIMISNCIVYVLLWVLLAIFGFLMCGATFGYYVLYKMPLVIYVMFTFLKLFLILNTLVMIGFVLEKLLFPYFSALFSIVVLGIGMVTPITISTKGFVEGFQLDISYYFYTLPYSSFFTEIKYTLGMILILLFVYFICKAILYKMIKFKKNRKTDYGL